LSLVTFDYLAAVIMTIYNMCCSIIILNMKKHLTQT